MELVRKNLVQARPTLSIIKYTRNTLVETFCRKSCIHALHSVLL